MLWGGVINWPPDHKQTLVLGDFRRSVVVPGWAGPQGGGSGCRINTPWEPLLWCQVRGSCCCVCLPWLEERRRWSSRRNGDLLSSYRQTKPPFSVPKWYPCPCTASQLELGKLRVARRARKGFGQLLTPLARLKSTTVCAVPSVGWRSGLLPCWAGGGLCSLPG